MIHLPHIIYPLKYYYKKLTTEVTDIHPTINNLSAQENMLPDSYRRDIRSLPGNSIVSRSKHGGYRNNPSSKYSLNRNQKVKYSDSTETRIYSTGYDASSGAFPVNSSGPAGGLPVCRGKYGAVGVGEIG